MAVLTVTQTIWLKAAPVAFDGDRFEDLEPAEQAIIILIGSVFLLGLLAVTITIIFLLYRALAAVPPDFREMEPSLVWLLLIPCFNLLWNFFVYARISRSYQNCLQEHGRFDVGDCGAGIGVAYSICVLLASIPCLNYITGIFCAPAALILQIIYLVKIYGLKREIESGDPVWLNER